MVRVVCRTKRWRASAAQKFYEGARRVFEKTFRMEEEERGEWCGECKEGTEADTVPAGRWFSRPMERGPQDPEDLSQPNRKVNNIVEFGAAKPHACRDFELRFANLLRVHGRVFVTHACQFSGGGVRTYVKSRGNCYIQIMYAPMSSFFGIA